MKVIKSQKTVTILTERNNTPIVAITSVSVVARDRRGVVADENWSLLEGLPGLH